MKRFAQLFTDLDQTTSTNAKVAALAGYFRAAPEEDRLWTIALLSGRRPKRTVTTTKLREWAAEAAEIPAWLFDEAYPIVGDLAETIALVLPPARNRADKSLSGWIKEIRALATKEDGERKTRIRAAWDSLDPIERFLFNKLITGGFRIGVSQKLMTRALSQATGIEEPKLAHLLMGDWTPETTSYQTLILDPDPSTDLSKPYPFYLAYQLDSETSDLGPPAEWSAEWKWDWHPRPAHLARRIAFLMVAGRGTDDRSVPRICNGSRFCPRWHGNRRRSAGLARRKTYVFQCFAKTHRAEIGSEEASFRGPGDPSGL